MNLQEKINNTEIGRFDLIKYKYGLIRGVKFHQGKKLRAMEYEAIDN